MGTGYTHTESMTSHATSYIEFYASDSNAIYGGNTTVQPPALSLLPQIRY